MYSLESDMMIQVIRQFGYSGDCHADIPPQGSLKHGAHAILVAHKGMITSISIFSRNGKKQYHDKEALSVLSQSGVLDWTLVPSSTTPPVYSVTPSPPVRSPDADSIIPLRLRRLPVNQSQIRAWSTLHRSVYALIDGTRSIEQIASLLSRRPTVIKQIIRELHSQNALE